MTPRMPSPPDIAQVHAWIDRAGSRREGASDLAGAVADGVGDVVPRRAPGVTS
jgi:predicted nucleotidyltransferase